MPRASATSRGNKASSSRSKVSLHLVRLPTSLTHPPCVLAVRGIGTSLATTMNWGANLLINSTYLSLMSAITPAGAFGFYAGLCLLGWLFCLFCFPETAGLSLEEAQMIFQHGFGIRASERLRHEKRELKRAEAERAAEEA